MTKNGESNFRKNWRTGSLERRTLPEHVTEKPKENLRKLKISKP